MKSGKESEKTPVHCEPWKLVWPREVQRFLEYAWIPRTAVRRWRRPWMPDEWMPDMDVVEREGKLMVRADLPGVKRADVQARVDGETLVVHGQRDEKDGVTEEDYSHRERRTGMFMRIVGLPEGFNPYGIEIRYTDGVVEVTVPKPGSVETGRYTAEVSSSAGRPLRDGGLPRTDGRKQDDGRQT